MSRVSLSFRPTSHRGAEESLEQWGYETRDPSASVEPSLGMTL